MSSKASDKYWKSVELEALVDGESCVELNKARGASDEGLIASYNVTRSVYKTARTFNMPAREVYHRLRAHGVVPVDDRLERVASFEASERAKSMPRSLAQIWLAALERESGSLKHIAKRHSSSPSLMVDTVRHHFPREYEIIADRRRFAGKYKAGKRVEDEVRADLRARGFGHVHRSHRSIGQVDLYAFHPQMRPWFVQVKASLELRPDERAALFLLARKSGALAVLAGHNAEGALEYWQLTSETEQWKV